MTNAPDASHFRGAVDLSSLVRKRNAPPPAATDGSGSATALVRESTDASFGEFLELSRTVPVLVEFYASEPTASLASAIEASGGRFVLVRVDVHANPQLARAFQVAAAPTVGAVIGGNPLVLYEGELPEEQLRPMLDQLDAAAAQSGVSGRVSVEGADEAPEAPEDEPLPPLHQEAYDAISRGDLDEAAAAYRKAIAQSPSDALAVAGLAQVSLLQRLQGADAGAIRTTAAERPRDVAAQLAVADLDVSGGHLVDAFTRLLELFPALDASEKELVRARLLEYFEIAGPHDERVLAARRQLASLLY